jgi:predicted deacylase
MHRKNIFYKGGSLDLDELNLLNNVLKVQDVEAPRGKKKQGYLKISEKPAGPHQIPITLINGYQDGPVILVNGGEHGSEYNGPGACLRLMVELDPMNIDGAVIIVPMVNTLAFEARWMHSNPVDYRDLTGCYIPEIPRGGSGHPRISYQVAHTFYNEVISKVDYRFNLHGGDIEEDLLTGVMFRKTGTDQKRDEATFALARNFGWKWIRENLPRPSSASSKSLPMPITLGTEAGGMGRCQQDTVDQVVKGIINGMKHLKMIEGIPEIPQKAYVFNPYHLYAERGGFFISNVRAGDIVKEGDVLGVIKSLFGETLEEIVVPTDGVIHMVTSPAIYEGDVVYEIGKDIREVS